MYFKQERLCVCNYRLLILLSGIRNLKTNPEYLRCVLLQKYRHGFIKTVNGNFQPVIP